MSPNNQWKPIPEQEAVNYMYDFVYGNLAENTSPECRKIIMPFFRDVTYALKRRLEEATNDKQQ